MPLSNLYKMYPFELFQPLYLSVNGLYSHCNVKMTQLQNQKKEEIIFRIQSFLFIIIRKS